MPKSKKVDADYEKPPRRAPITTVEGREDELIALATNLAERRLREGTASSQEVVHFLKLGSTKARLEKEKLRKENQLLEAKAESLKASREIKELYEEAMEAMKTYSGRSS